MLLDISKKSQTSWHLLIAKWYSYLKQMIFWEQLNTTWELVTGIWYRKRTTNKKCIIPKCLLIIHKFNYFWFSVCSFLSRCHEHVSGVWMKNGYDFLPPFGEEAGQILQLRGINSRYPCIKYSFGCTGLRLDGLSEIIR